MTTFTDFSPSPSAPFQFQPTLDGVQYTAVVTWSLFRRGYYLNLYQLDGTLVMSRALVGSPTGADIQALSWANGSALVQTVNPHGYSPVGKMVSLTISGCSPDAYNGTRPCQVTGVNSLTFPISSNPGAGVVLGRLDYDISLVAGFFSSTLVYRKANGQFEVSP